MHKFFEGKFTKKELRIERSYPIEDELYEFMASITNEYNANISDVLNACIQELIESENFNIYSSGETNFPLHSFQIDKSNVEGLKELNRKTEFTFKSLVNMSIRNVKNMDE